MKTALVLLLSFFSSPGVAAEITVSSQVWLVQTEFAKSADARNSLSGAACVTGTNHCLIANDEKKYAQFFDLGTNILRPGRVIKLLADKVGGVDMGEIDAEAVAFSNGVFFVTGSHGLTRKKGEFQPSIFHLFRFKVDLSTGLPTFAFDDDDPVSAIESTGMLREVIRAEPGLSPFAERRLDDNGATIEGMVAQGSDLLFGFRAPSVGAAKDVALVLRVNAEALFGLEKPAAKLHELTLEPGLGIRDMASVRSGVLLLVGPSGDVPGAASLWLWDATATPPKKIGDFPAIAASAKAETLLVLAEDEASIHVLVLFDGMENGAPREFKVTK